MTSWKKASYTLSAGSKELTTLAFPLVLRCNSQEKSNHLDKISVINAFSRHVPARKWDEPLRPLTPVKAPCLLSGKAGPCVWQSSCCSCSLSCTPPDGMPWRSRLPSWWRRRGPCGHLLRKPEDPQSLPIAHSDMPTTEECHSVTLLTLIMTIFKKFNPL